MNWNYRIAGSVSFIFSRKPNAAECKYLQENYGGPDSTYQLNPCPDSYASDNVVLARVAENIRHSKAKQ